MRQESVAEGLGRVTHLSAFLRLFGHDLAVAPYVNRRAVQTGGFARFAGGTT